MFVVDLTTSTGPGRPRRQSLGPPFVRGLRGTTSPLCRGTNAGHLGLGPNLSSEGITLDLGDGLRIDETEAQGYSCPATPCALLAPPGIICPSWSRSGAMRWMQRTRKPEEMAMKGPDRRSHATSLHRRHRRGGCRWARSRWSPYRLG